MLISPFYGDVARAVEIGRQALERDGDTPQLAAGYAIVLWFAGDYEQVRTLLEPRVRLEQPPVFKVWTLSILALTAADEGDGELAERHAREAMAVVEQVGGQTATEFTGVPAVLANALRLRGGLEEAREHMSVALERESRRPGSIGHAMALILDAQLALAQRDRPRAHADAAQARKIIDRYPDVGVLADRLATVEAALERHTAGPAPGSQPTAAELRVLALLPTDLTADQIAARLHLSTDTVRSHARRLYRRIGAHTRAEAVASARERGLL